MTRFVSNFLTAIFSSLNLTRDAKDSAVTRETQTAESASNQQAASKRKRKRRNRGNPNKRRRRDSGGPQSSLSLSENEDDSEPGDEGDSVRHEDGEDGEDGEGALSDQDEESGVPRKLMPPPPMSHVRILKEKIDPGPGNRRESLDTDTGSQVSFRTRSTRQPQGLADDGYAMEKARRHAAATTLPPNSGIWEQGEKELFYHLSYRGFEPLLPNNWMKDFPTMPFSLYAKDTDDVPLIRTYHRREFRAIRELRELLDIGRNVRDKVLTTPGARMEKVIERASSKYISWALDDAGIKIRRSRLSSLSASATSSWLPIHTIVTLKRGQTHEHCVEEMKYRLHTLAARHRKAQNIHASVESHTSCATPEAKVNTESDADMDTTQVIEHEEDDLPVLYGLMICSSIIAVFTMNSHTPLPKKPFLPHQSRRSQPSPNAAASTGVDVDAPSSPAPRRFQDVSHILASEEDQAVRIKEEEDIGVYTSPSGVVISTQVDEFAQPPHDEQAERARLESRDGDERAERSNTRSPTQTEEEEDSASDPRFISSFDLGDPARDVWNALVIAILAMQIRREMLVTKRPPSPDDDGGTRLEVDETFCGDDSMFSATGHEMSPILSIRNRESTRKKRRRDDPDDPDDPDL